METVVPRLAYVWARARDRTGPVIVWGIWAALLLSAILLIRQNTRNLPHMDDFSLVPVVTGHQPMSAGWLWSQRKEHRPFLSRLILVGLLRYVDTDFRLGLYLNVGLMAMAAASMLLFARRLRGYTSVTDAVLPLSILNLGQAECFMLCYALNMVLTAWVSFALIAAVGTAGCQPGWRAALRVGLLLVLLPLCGGSSVVMLPPLVLWLAGSIAWGWRSGREPGSAERVIGVASLIACSALFALYVSGYSTPKTSAPSPSLAAVASTMLQYFSLVVGAPLWGYEAHSVYWRLAGLGVVLLTAATLLRLAAVALRVPGERPRAIGLIAIILSMLNIALAVGLSRSGLYAGVGFSSRYVTVSAPLLSVLYVAWLTCGPAPARWVVHVALLVVVCLAVPPNARYARILGERRKAVNLQVERDLTARVPGTRLLAEACPGIYHLDRDYVYDCFRMLRDRHIGKFSYFVDDRAVAAAPNHGSAVR